MSASADSASSKAPTHSKPRLINSCNHPLFLIPSPATREAAMQEDQRSDVSQQSQGMLARWRSAWTERTPANAGDADFGLECALPWLVPEHAPPGQA